MIFLNLIFGAWLLIRYTVFIDHHWACGVRAAKFVSSKMCWDLKNCEVQWSIVILRCGGLVVVRCGGPVVERCGGL